MVCLEEDAGPPFFLGTSLSVRPQLAHWPLGGVFSPGLVCLVARVAGKDPFSWKESLNRFLTTDVPSTIFFSLYSLV